METTQRRNGLSAINALGGGQRVMRRHANSGSPCGRVSNRNPCVMTRVTKIRVLGAAGQHTMEGVPSQRF